MKNGIKALFIALAITSSAHTASSTSSSDSDLSKTYSRLRTDKELRGNAACRDDVRKVMAALTELNYIEAYVIKELQKPDRDSDAIDTATLCLLEIRSLRDKSMEIIKIYVAPYLVELPKPRLYNGSSF